MQIFDTDHFRENYKEISEEDFKEAHLNANYETEQIVDFDGEEYLVSFYIKASKESKEGSFSFFADSPCDYYGYCDVDVHKVVCLLSDENGVTYCLEYTGDGAEMQKIEDYVETGVSYDEEF